MDDGAVLGVDIGTTSTKAVAFDLSGRPRAAHDVGYALREPSPGYAEQDPDEIVAAVAETIRRTVAECPCPVLGVSFSAALHSLIGLDGRRHPITPSLTWADRRATDQADGLRASPAGLALHRRTGTPVHPMSPLVKLIWYRENVPAVFARVSRWLGIKEYVLGRLFGADVIDHSIASGTGLLDLQRLDWDPEALELAGIRDAQLPPLVPATHRLALPAAAATDLGLEADAALVVGAADGPLANLGVGAVRPGVAACSIGTSGALRVMVDRPAVDARGRVFCYALTPNRWSVGGAVSNGGIVLEWAGEALAPDVSGPRELLAMAEQAPPGSAGLIMLPYLLRERAPQWDSRARGAYVGLSREHGRPHLVRAALEGVCLQLSLVLDAVRESGQAVTELRATGGFARSPLWRQILTDTLAMPVGFPEGQQGSAFGAAILGMQVLGLVDSLDRAADLVTIAETVQPQPEAAAVYAQLKPVFTGLHDALAPIFAAWP